MIEVENVFGSLAVIDLVSSRILKLHHEVGLMHLRSRVGRLVGWWVEGCDLSRVGRLVGRSVEAITGRSRVGGLKDVTCLGFGRLVG